MHRQGGYSRFPAAFLTFSLLLLVLAAGFVLGRVVVARAYERTAPKFERPPTWEPGVVAEAPPEASFTPGGVNVPPPAPPEEPPEAGVEPTEAGEAAPGEVGEAGRGEEAAGAGRAEPGATASPPSPVPEAPAVSIGPEGRPQPEESGEVKYSIQVGIFAGRDGARRLADELARAGYPARIDVERRGSGMRYRVLTGQYRTEYAARKAVEELRREGFEAFLVRQ